jgi:hypothetical protein
MVGLMEAFRGESTLQKDQNCFKLYCFSKYPCLNFNHVIMKKDVFAYYGMSKHKEVKYQRNCTFFIAYDVMLEYICVKTMYITTY